MEPNAANEKRQTAAGDAPKIIYLTDEARAQKEGKCPYCGGEVASDAGKCEHCGKSLATSSEAAEKASSSGAVNFDSLGYVKSALASKYEVLEEVVKTDTSNIFRAIHLALGKEVALKVLLRSVAQDRDYTDRFHRRARAIDKLSQSNIIRIYDEGVDSGIHYMAMEFLKGINLEGRIARHGTLSPDEMTSILMPIINALGHAHRHGIVHGNIKCSSIFIHDDGRIILFGFGTQRLTSGNQLSFNRDQNSFEYLSPEEASGKVADGRSDIYSLGIVMYYSLTGRFPYSGSNSAITINAITTGQYTPINRLRPLPQWYERIVDKCLQKDVMKRIQSCGELVGLFNASATASSTSAKSSEQLEREILPAELPKEQPAAKIKTSPVVEQPIEREPSIIEHPRVKPPAVIEEPAGYEVKGEGKGKSKALLLIAAFAMVAVLAVGITLMMKSGNGNSNGLLAPSGNTRQMRTEENSLPSRENINNNAARPTQQAPSTEITKPVPPPTTSTDQEASSSETRKPSSLKASARSKVSSSKEAQKEQIVTPPPAVSTVSVPDLTGTQLNTAKSILSLNGLSVGAVSTIPDPANDGIVIRQVPKPGTQLKKGSTVNLIVGSK
ncbi:MAG TPA: protein kinase [Candidatus Acidoferrales bacterium]|nr:protein kinase [Candidatus Acidoferrales bacterium]